MSTILKALEKARKERERQRREQERQKKQLDRIKKEDVIRKPPGESPPKTGLPTQPVYPSRFLVLALLFFVLGVGVLGVAVYFFYRVQNMLCSIPSEEGFKRDVVVSKRQVEVTRLQKGTSPEAETTGIKKLPKPSVAKEKQYKKHAAKNAIENPFKVQREATRKKSARATKAPEHSPMPAPTSTAVEMKAAKKPIPVATERKKGRLQIAKHTQSLALPEPPPQKKYPSARPGLTHTPKPALPSAKRPAPQESLQQTPQGKEPTTPIKDISAEKIGLRVGGVFWDEKKPMAIINGVIVGEGDYIKDMQILKIFRQSLRVKKDSKIYNVLF